MKSTKFMSLKVYYTYSSLSVLLYKFWYIWLLDTIQNSSALCYNKLRDDFSTPVSLDSAT